LCRKQPSFLCSVEFLGSMCIYYVKVSSWNKGMPVHNHVSLLEKYEKEKGINN
jgi:hypothetical protein